MNDRRLERINEIMVEFASATFSRDDIILIQLLLQHGIRSGKPWFLPSYLFRNVAAICFHLGTAYERAKRKREIGEL